MALGFSFFPSSSTTSPPSPPPPPSDGIHVVGRQHALLAGTLHAAIHPALVNLVHVYDHVPVHEGHLVIVGGRVVVNGPVAFLRGTHLWDVWGNICCRRLRTSWSTGVFLLLYRRFKEVLPHCWEERQQQPAALVREQDHSGSSGSWQVADNQLERERINQKFLPLRLVKKKNHLISVIVYKPCYFKIRFSNYFTLHSGKLLHIDCVKHFDL